MKSAATRARNRFAFRRVLPDRHYGLGRGCGDGLCLGSGVLLGVGVGRGVAVGVAVGVDDGVPHGVSMYVRDTFCGGESGQQMQKSSV